MKTGDAPRPVRRFGPSFDWEGVASLAYKPEGTHFKDITRRVLFGSECGGRAELRYFEIAAGGHSTLERHAHVHAVLVLRGRGRCLIGDAVHALETFDLVHVPPQTWHQFRATETDPLGFLCLVDADRDRPVRPTPTELEALRQSPEVAAFLR